MNYKKSDDELIKRQRQGQDKNRERVTKQTNALTNKTYSGKALDALAKGDYQKLKTQSKPVESKPIANKPVVVSSTNKVPELKNSSKNLRQQGFPGSYSSDPIDFDYVLKNDKTFGNKGFSLGLLNADTDIRRRYGSNSDKSSNEIYYKRFGRSRDEVLDEYEKYQAEKHPILTALKDIGSAPDRALNSAAGTAAHALFPYSDLDKMLNSDLLQEKVKDVQRRRDYIQDSDKVSGTKKAVAKAAGRIGDSATNIALSGLLAGTSVPAQLLEGTSGGLMAVGGTQPLAQSMPYLTKLLNGIGEYGLETQEKKHEKMREGVDYDTATDYANAEGIASGIMAALATGGAGNTINELGNGIKGVLPAIKQGAKIAAPLAGGRQLASEVIEPLTLDDKSTVKQDIQKYLDKGNTETEAILKAIGKGAGRVGGATAAGGITGGLLAGLGYGLSQLGKGATNGLNEYAVNQITQNDVLGLPQNDIPTIHGMNQLALPESQLPANVIQLPGTNGVIPLEGSVAVKNAAARAASNPRLVIPLEGAELDKANARINELKTTIKGKKTEVKALKEAWQNASKKNKDAAYQKYQASNNELAALQDESKELELNVKGGTRPAKDMIKKQDADLYNEIYGRKTGVMDYLNYAAKFAGDTPEAKQLSKDIKNTLEEYIETGDAFNTILTPDNVAKVAQLDELAKTNNKEYLKTTFAEAFSSFDPETDTFDNSNPSIWNKLYENDRIERINGFHNGIADTNNVGVDNDGIVPYNEGTKGEFADGRLQTSRGNDGTGSEGILRNAYEDGRMAEEIRGVESERRGYLPPDSIRRTEQLSQNGSVFTDEDLTTLSKSGLQTQNFNNANTDPAVYVDALEAAKSSSSNGAAVDSHTVEELQEIINNGGNLFLTSDGTVGYAVEGNGNLTGVFKNKNNKTPFMGSVIALASTKNGAVKGDCFGRKLVNIYAHGGYEPVARMNYGYGFNDAMDAQVKEQLAKGIISKEPDVYVLKLRDDFDYNSAVAGFNGGDIYTQEQLDALPLFDDYDEMLAYRDSLIKQPTSEGAFSDPDNGYWLRVLGDNDFLMQEAQKQNVSPQTLLDYAGQNLGYDAIPRVTSGNVPPNNNIPNVNGTSGDKQKTSQYYKNTMRRTEENAKMSDEEYHERFNENEYKYTPYTDAESEKEGYDFISRAGGHDAAVEKILNGKFDDETKPFSHVEVDATHILADRAEKEAKELEAQGLDATAKWREADRLHKKLRAELNRSAGAMQANQKWIKKTPRGALDNLVTEANKTIDRKKTKGYSEMVDNLADNVEDAILNNEGKARVDAIKKAFAGKKNKSYKTDQYEQMVLDLVGGEDANKRSSASLAEEAAKLIKKKMGVSTLSLKDERAMLNLFEEASRYEQGSRSYKECIAQAMKIFDANLPSNVSDKFKSLWYDNMLFSIKTMMTRNFGGNLGANAIENIATPLQVGADWLASKVTGQRSRTFSGKAITEGAKGMGKGFKDWYLDIKNGVNTTRSGQETMADALNAANTTFKPNPDNKVLDWVNKAGSKYDRIVRKGMEVGDRPIYEAKYAATKAELEAVVDKFGEEGIRKGLPDGDYSLDDVIELIAVNDALESVLQNNTHMKEGMKAAKKFLKETSESLIGTDVSSMIMPFIEVSGNMADRYFQYTPFGMVGNVLRSVYEKKKYGSINQRRMTGEAGRNILGGLLTAGAIGLASKGLISDPYSEDKDEKKRQQQNDYQEYALQKADGSVQRDFADIPIFGPKLRESKMEYDALKEGGLPELLKAMPSAIGSATLDSLFQGLNKVTGGNNKYGSTGGDNYIGNAAEALKSLPGSITIPSMVRQTAQFLDPYKRDLGDYGTNEYYVNSFINGLPILRERMLDPKINTAGEPVKQFGDEKGLQRFVDTYISPWKKTRPNDNISNAQKYADELKAQTNGEVNPQPQVFNASDLKKVKGYDPDKYTHEDLRQFQDNFYKTNNELADTLISQDWFRELDPGKQGKYLDMLYASNKDINKEEFVRKGLSDAEIEAAKDTLFTGDDKLTKIMRDDDADHSGMLEYFKNKSGLDMLNDKYDTDVGYDTYVKWNTDSEKKALGGAEAYAANYKAAKELDMQVDTYLQKQSSYPGGAKKYANDKKELDAINEKYGTSMTMETYNKNGKLGTEKKAKESREAKDVGMVTKDGNAQPEQLQKAKDKAGSQWRKLERDLPTLKGMGLDTSAIYTYASAIKNNGSINANEFAKTYNAINTNTKNGMTQDEMLAYLNKGSYSQEEANALWTTYGEGWKQVPVLVGGTWKKKKKK